MKLTTDRTQTVENCSDCSTPYNAVDNDECPYCDFPNL